MEFGTSDSITRPVARLASLKFSGGKSQDSLIHSFIHSFMLQVFTACLLTAEWTANATVCSLGWGQTLINYIDKYKV